MCDCDGAIGRTVKDPLTLGAPGGPVRRVWVKTPIAGLIWGEAHVTGLDVDRWIADGFLIPMP